MTISSEELLAKAMELIDDGVDYPGVCQDCGEVAEDHVDPDARAQECTVCGASAVYGCEEIVMMLAH